MSTVDLNLLFPPDQSGNHGPLPKQQQFLDYVLDIKGPKYVLYAGGVGSGKTMIGCITMITLAILYPGDYLICRQFNPELRLTTMKTFLDICPKELIVEHRAADQIVKIRSQSGKISNVIFRGLEEPDKHRSLNLNAAYIDESSQVSEAAFVVLQSRLRGPHVRKIFMTTNPAGHDWQHRMFVKQDFDPSAKHYFKFITAPSTENTHLPDGYVQSMLATWSEERINRDIYASWDVFAGQIYTEFNRQVHVIKPFEIPKEWPRFAGMDHGYTNPAACIWGAIDYDGNVYLYKEFYQTSLTIKEICKEILRINDKDKLEAIYIDPSTKAVKSQTGASDFSAYMDNLPSKIALLPAKNDVSQGIDRVKTYLKINEKTKKPRLYFFNTLVNTIEEITQYQWEELGPGMQGRSNEKEKPKKYKDHAADAVRYLLMSRPEDPKPVVDPEKSPWVSPSTSIQDELADIRKPKPRDPFGF